MTDLVRLKISSWVGTSYGALHYYGEMKWDDERGRWDIRLQHKMTSSQAKAFNKNRAHCFPGEEHPIIHNSGDIIDGFDSKEDVIEAAKKLYHELGLKCGMQDGYDWNNIIIEPEEVQDLSGISELKTPGI